MATDAGHAIGSIESWLGGRDPTQQGRATLAEIGRGLLPAGGRFSLLVVADALDEIWCKATVDSVRAQVYPSFELVVVVPASAKFRAGEVGRNYSDRRVEFVDSSAAGRAELAREALRRAEGDWFAFVGHGDRIAPLALFRVAELLAQVEADVVYTDEDRIDELDRHSAPVAKPYWSPELLLSAAGDERDSYPGGLCVMRGSLARALLERDGDELERPLGGDPLRAAWQPELRAIHLPACLYHRRDLSAGSPPAAVPTTDVRGGVTEQTAAAPQPRTVAAIVTAPGPGSDSPVAAQLRALAPGALANVTVAEPASSGAGAKPAGALSQAVARTDAELLLFVDGRGSLDPATEDSWLEQAVELISRPGVAAVGGRVRDPAGGWLQAGLRPNLGPLAPARVDTAVRPPLADRVCNPLGFGPGALLIARATFDGLGGFDATDYGDALFELDLTLRASRAGLRNVHLPSLTVSLPGPADAADAEVARFVRHWTAELSVIGAYDRAALQAPGSRAFEPGPRRPPVPRPGGGVVALRSLTQVGA